MKRIWIFIVVIAVAYSCNTTTTKDDQKTKNDDNDLVVITGKIENNREPYAIITFGSETDSIKISENGEIDIKFPLVHASHIIFTSGGNHARIYVNPKSKLSFTANAENFMETLTFTGDDADVNNYLATQSAFMVNAGIRNENFLYSSKYETFLSSLDELVETLNSNLNAFSQKFTINYEEFISLEKERFNLISGTLILTYYTPIINTNGTNEVLDKKLNELVYSTDLNNPIMIQLYEFKPFVQNLIALRLNKQIKEKKIEFKSAEEYANSYFAIIDETFVESEVVEELYYSFMKDFVAYYGAESVLAIYGKYKDFSTNKSRLSELDKIFAEYSKLAKGQASVNWTFPDINGKNYSLTDFRGKYVYIDVWASWCGPCKRELPSLAQLKETFKGKNIAIIGISVDENKADWQNMINSGELNGIQLYAQGWANPLCEFFKITGIPRFILLDKEGNIINANADRPSGDIETVLNNLEGI